MEKSYYMENGSVHVFIRSKIDILYVIIFKYSLHKYRETTLYGKYQF